MTPDKSESAAGTPLRILFYEDCTADIDLAVCSLQSRGFDVTWDAAANAPEFLERARAASYDVVLSDYNMPSLNGLELFDLLKSSGISIPFILLAGSLGEEQAAECLKQGVADFVLKDRLARLPAAIRRAREDEKARLQHAEALEALRRSEASYRSLIQSAPCGILRLNAADGRLTDANDALARMMGYESVADLLQASAQGGVALDPEALMELTAEAQTNAGGLVRSDAQWKRRNGTELSIRLAGRLLRDDAGVPANFEMIAENVTESYAAQRQIRQLVRLNTVLIHAGDAIVRLREVDPLVQEICRIIVEDGGFRLAWFGLLGHGGETVVPGCVWPPRDWGLSEAFAKADPGAETHAEVAAAIRGQRLVVCNDIAGESSAPAWRTRALESGLRSLAVLPIVVHGQTAGVIAIYASTAGGFDTGNLALLGELAADLSFALESIETEKTHQRVAGELDQFFSLSLELMLIFDLHGSIQRINPAWEKTLGLPASIMLGRTWVHFVRPEDRPRAEDALRRLRSGQEVRELELRFLSRDGDCRWLEGGATPCLEWGIAFAAMRDITHRKQLEEQLRRQNLILEERNRKIEAASRLKSEFLANMSHELRSPMNGIIGFSELLFDGKLGAVPERAREFIGRIHASASHLLQLINGILDLSKIEAGRLEFHPERVALAPIIHEVIGILSPVALNKQIQVETEIDPDVQEATIDASRFRQVLYNYFSNALKFTAEHGRVVVRLRSAGAGHFRLEVVDTGIGIARKDLERLFVEFQQLDGTSAKRYAGTGLGLALTKRIVEAQGGEVWAESEPGMGSTFYATLPREPGVFPGANAGKRILVVDDFDIDRQMLTRILEQKGYVVETAANAAEACDKCKRRKFDAITVAVALPHCPDWEALEQVRRLEQHRDTPVIVISTADPKDLQLPIAVQGFLEKPVQADQLAAVLTRAGALAKGAQVFHG